MKLFFKILIPFLVCLTYSQELPPVTVFSTHDYQADNQNWSITQNENREIFAANNKGLLSFNGESWTLSPSPNESIIRSVHAFKGKVYSGCYRDFGYWNKNEKGVLNYTSLVEEFNLQLEEDEQFWKILDFEKFILFQSLGNIYIYDSELGSIDKIKNIDEVFKMFVIQDQIYFSKPSQGIFQIVNQKAELVNNADVFTNNLVLNLYEVNDQILVQTDKEGIYTLSSTPEPWGNENIDLLNSITVYNSIQSSNGELVLGTISDGVIIMNQDASLKYHLNQNKSLSNNTVLSLFEDIDKNIWLGLDNGINCINQASPIKIYNDESGNVGTVYTSKVFENHLFIGTNQGLFYKDLSLTETEFKLVKNSNGQVWDLFIHDQKLFCGHNNGAFLVDDLELKPISTSTGIWCFKAIPNQPDKLLLGTYLGLSILEKDVDNWKHSDNINGFKISSKFVEFIDANHLLVDHEYKGVYSLKLNDSFTNIKKIKQHEEVDKGLYSSLASINNEIYYAYEKGIFKFDNSNKAFKLDSTLTKISYSKDQYSSGKLIPTENLKSLWSFTNKGINYISPGKLSQDYDLIFIPIPSDVRNAMVGYENITKIDENLHLFGNSQGYLLLDLDKIKAHQKPIETSLNWVRANELDGEPYMLPLDEKNSLLNKQNNLEFSFSTPVYDDLYEVEYQYKLDGLNENWSTWSNNNAATFSNLPFGDYTFKVRSRRGSVLSENIIAWPVEIKRPFVLSNTMLMVYAIVIILIIIITHNIYKQYYKKQRKKIDFENKRQLELNKLEAEQKIMNIENEKLQQDIDSKNRELAISTMSLIKKNEFLNRIKSELNTVPKNESGIKRILRIIDRNLNNTDDWKFFEEAFNNADKDFLKKIKSKHPALTPNDLRLCAYLRLNLSSKEIAPLFNISVKSVEVKRYRLRKKMDLPRETSLTNYILEI